jgi:hypothetical protein
MSSSLIITLEMGGVLGVVLLFGLWELWSLRRERRRDQARGQSAERPDPHDAGPTP